MAEVQFYSAPGKKRLRPITNNSKIYISIPAKQLLDKINHKCSHNGLFEDNATKGKKRLKKINIIHSDNAMTNSCSTMKGEIEAKKRCEVVQFLKYIPKILKLILLNKLKMINKAWIDYVIKIQAQIRGHDRKIKFLQMKNNVMLICKAYKRHYWQRRHFNAIAVQKNWRRKLILIKYADKLNDIKGYIKHEKNKKEYEKMIQLMNRKRKAVRVIERYWNIVLERRYQKQLEEQLSKMSPESRELYRKFLVLRRETKSLKRDLIEFTQKEASKGK